MRLNAVIQETEEAHGVQNILKRLLALNKSAMMKLKYQKYRSCLEILEEAKGVVVTLARNKTISKTKKFCSVASITYNNLGCYYQKKNQNTQSIRFYQKSLGYSKHIEGDEINLSSTYLNICSLFSQMGDHEEAYKHGRVSLRLLPIAYRKCKEQMEDKQREPEERYKDPAFDNLLMTMVIAYYNVATECEFLGNYQEALKHFIRGYEWGSKSFGKDDELVRKIKKCIFQIKKRIYKPNEQCQPSSASTKFTLKSKPSIGQILRSNMKKSKVLKKLKPRAFSEKKNEENSLKRNQPGNEVLSMYNSSEITDGFTANSAKNSSISQKLRYSQIYQRNHENNENEMYSPDGRKSSKSRISRKNLTKNTNPFRPLGQIEVSSFGGEAQDKTRNNSRHNQDESYLPAVPILSMYDSKILSTSMKMETKKGEIQQKSPDNLRKSMKHRLFSPKLKKRSPNQKIKPFKKRSKRYAPIRPNIEVFVQARGANKSLESIHEESKHDSVVALSSTQEKYFKTRQRYKSKVTMKRRNKAQSKSSFFDYNLSKDMNLTQEGMRRRNRCNEIEGIKSRVNNISKCKRSPTSKEIQDFELYSCGVNTTDLRNQGKDKIGSSLDSIDLVQPTISLPSHVRVRQVGAKIEKNFQ
ncbi:unnamed protein product [Moneuplotes crassus]|uniref:Uncharacterized protein n=1 Tax=Euplotes crassus TaxID=5936 RepID=A0AAD1X516_EUPCR|nr:unnamed protein product [Moneuplotes crassus]